jgi:hypothetical protein
LLTEPSLSDAEAFIVTVAGETNDALFEGE